MNPTAWPPIGVRQRLIEHKDLMDLVQTYSASRDRDPAIESSLARYLIVRSAGLIETTRDDVADEYCKAFQAPRIHSRVVSGLRGGLGAKPEQLKKFIESFDKTWKQDFEFYLAENDSALSSDLGSLVNARIKIAHGNGERVDSARSLRYARSAREVSKWLIKCFDPS